MSATSSNESTDKHIVIIGGGFAGTATALNLEKTFRRDPSVEITLIDAENFFTFTPLLPEVPSGSIQPKDVTKQLYKEILHADLDDPYLGLGQTLFAGYPFAKEDKGETALDWAKKMGRKEKAALLEEAMTGKKQ